MSTKKTTTPEKQYLVLDADQDMVAYGTMNEITDTLSDYNDVDEDGFDDISFDEWVTQLTLHEVGAGKKIKYTPAKFEIK